MGMHPCVKVNFPNFNIYILFAPSINHIFELFWMCVLKFVNSQIKIVLKIMIIFQIEMFIFI